jgi:hypothetical protein
MATAAAARRLTCVQNGPSLPYSMACQSGPGQLFWSCMRMLQGQLLLPQEPLLVGIYQACRARAIQVNNLLIFAACSVPWMMSMHTLGTGACRPAGLLSESLQADHDCSMQIKNVQAPEHSDGLCSLAMLTLPSPCT